MPLKFELRPNTKKIFLVSLVKALGTLALIIGAFLYFKYIFELDMFQEILDEFGIPLSLDTVLTVLLILVPLITILSLILHYIKLGGVKYEFHDDKMILFRNLYMVSLQQLEIPYLNILRMNFETNDVLKTGTINIELTGTKKKSIKLDFIDNPVETVNSIENLINQFKARYIEKTQEQQGIDAVMERW